MTPTRERRRPQMPEPSTTIERANRGRVYDTQEKQADPITYSAATPARVRVGDGVTRNMGDYESVRVHVEIEMACENTVDAAHALYEECSKFVDERIALELAIATGENA